VYFRVEGRGILAGKPLEKCPTGRPRQRCVDNTETELPK
jgi:hypothetical protein